LTAGTGIAIVNNVISATGGSGGGSNYFAGDGINIDSNNYISVNTGLIATKEDLQSKQDTLTAGANIDINNGVISASQLVYYPGSGISIDENNVISANANRLKFTLDSQGNLYYEYVEEEVEPNV